MERRRLSIYSMSTSELLTDEAKFSKLYECVPKQRKAKVDGYRFKKDKALSLAAGLLLKRALQEAGLDGDGELGYGQYGKPYPKGAEDVHFSLSHSGEWAVCALSDNPVGCDIEAMRNADMRIAKRFFAPEEYEYLNSIRDDGRRTEAFFRLWTLKESYIKCTGEGISRPLDSFCIGFEDHRPFLKQGGGETFFYEPMQLPGYAFSCCTREEIDRQSLFELTADELLWFFGQQNRN